ncbi:MAG: DUF4136 domain-containing protein [Pseudomonadales bacterium]
MYKYPFLALLLALLVGCAAQIRVNSDYPEGIQFAQYQTYRWQDEANINQSGDEFLSSEFVDARVHANVDTQLRSKGYLYREQGPVDFLVSYKLSSEQREDLRSYGRYYDPWWSVGVFNRHSSLGYGIGLSGSPRLSVDRYLHASLVLDFEDAETGALIWRGKGEGRMPGEQTAEKRRETFERFVEKTLKNFPSHLAGQY